MGFLGHIIKGSLAKGIIGYINDNLNIEMFSVGSLIKINGFMNEYLGMIVDAGIDSIGVPGVALGEIDADIRDTLIESLADEIRKQWIKIVLVAQIKKKERIKGTADTMPSFFSGISEITSEDITAFYGMEDKVAKWNLGRPKAIGKVEVMVPIDISKLVQLHFGIFGKTGTGKTFLGNILASLIMQYDLRGDDYLRTKLLIFDMHSEYATKLRKTGGEPVESGVGELFKDRFLRYTVDEDEEKAYRLKLLKINILDIDVSDIPILAKIFNLTEAFVDHIQTIKTIVSKLIKRKEYWFIALLLLNSEVWRVIESDHPWIISEIFKGIHSHDEWYEYFRENAGKFMSTVIPNVSRLAKLMKFNLTFRENPLDEIVDNLTKKDGLSIIISFGKYEKEHDLYMFIANMLAKKLRNKILEVIEEKGSPETRIVIFLEEAHYFLGRETFRISPFGEIAREMRKRGVTLCIIDQKPYELDPDVITMLWTIFTFNLADRRDVEFAVYSSPNPSLYAEAVPRLGDREVLIYGYAVEQPVIISVRDYKEFARFIREEREKEDREGMELLDKIDY